MKIKLELAELPETEVIIRGDVTSEEVVYNDYARNPSEGWKMQHAYDTLVKNHGKATDCAVCKTCEQNCPQKLEITAFLEKVGQVF